MLENDLTNIEMLIMKCIWDTPEELALSQLVTMVSESACVVDVGIN